MTRLLRPTLLLVLGLLAGAAAAQENVIKFGPIRYTTHTHTNGITGIGIPAGADATTGDATTVIIVYERMLDPQLGAELVLGIPPRIHADASGTAAFLGSDILSAKNVAPTVFVNYHFAEPSATLRPYLGAGFNFTRFVGIRSRLATDVKMGDSFGWAVQAGVDYAVDRQWGVFASVAALKVKSKLVAAGSTVLQATLDFRPITWQAGVSYRF